MDTSIQGISKMKFNLCNFFIITSFFLSLTTIAKPLPIEIFSKGAEYFDVKVSPDGKLLSARSKFEGKNILFFIELATFKMINVVRFGNRAQVGDYHWVNNKRVVIEKEYIRGWKDHPEYYGELFGINADGSNRRYLIGYNAGEKQVGTHFKKNKALRGTSYVLDPLYNDEKHMLIMTIPWTGSNEPFTRVFKVNVNNGKRKKVTTAPVPMANYLTDNQGNVRFAASGSDYVNQDLYVLNSENKKWQKFNTKSDNYSNIKLYAFDESGEFVYAGASINGEPNGIYKINIAKESFELVHQDKIVDPSKIWVDDVTKELFAIEHESGFPSYTFVNNKSTMTKRLKSLLQTFKGEQVRIVSSSQNGDVSVVMTITDLNPGEFYLYKAKENKLSFLFSNRSWVDKSIMSESKPISFKSRDGLSIYGYLILPYGKKAKNLPLVVMPHGGPHGVRDWWEWDPEAQLLANHGIAVLKINFRGSGGFGTKFEYAGHKKWGAEIQYDIIDGVNYVIEQGYIDKDNMCIMGASFGGYSALQSAIVEPDLFKCAVGVFGVYDLPLMF